MNIYNELIEKNCLKDIIISFILMCAVLNDLLRIPYTSISLYRMLLPVGIWYIYKYRFLLKKELIILGIMILAILSQELLYIHYFYTTYNVSISHIIKYLLLYISIWMLFPLVHILFYEHKGEPWFWSKILWCYALILVPLYVMSVYKVPEFLMNRNNYACCISVLFPWLMLNGLYNSKKKYMPVAFILLAELFWGGSKAAIMGVFIQGLLFAVLEVAKRAKYSRGVLFCLLSLLCLGCITIIWTSDIMLLTDRTENISKMFRTMVERIYYGNVFVETHLGSLPYRINCIIYTIQNICYTFPFGIGPGNTGRVLAMAMPSMATEWNTFFYLSPHNPLLAFISDSGWFAVLMLYPIVKYILKNMIYVHNISLKREYGLIVFVSALMWNISPSEMFTIYFVFIMVAAIFYEEKYKEKGTA